MAHSPVEAAFELLTDDSALDARDIDEAVAKRQGRNFFTHVGSLAMTKIADGLIDPKLVLSWLLVSLGSPVFMTGLLVPVREAGALLPQMPLARLLAGVGVRKWLWVGGSLVQAVAAGAIAFFAVTLDGMAAGVAIVAALAVHALGRSVCSLSYKDVLGKTVARAARGTASGIASSTASAGVVAFGLVLASGMFARETLVAGAIVLAALLWLAAAGFFSTLYETPADARGGKAVGARKAGLALLREDPQLRIFIMTRGLLVSTALAPPFLVAMAGGPRDGGYGALGLLVLASAAASLVSGYVWGRLADRSSRTVLTAAALGGAVSLGCAAALDAAGLLSRPGLLPAVLFVLMVSYHGVRIGRTTHLVDMAPKDLRSAYAALSNTLIGLLVVAGGALSALAGITGPRAAILLLAACAFAAFMAARRLNEVQK